MTNPEVLSLLFTLLHPLFKGSGGGPKAVMFPRIKPQGKESGNPEVRLEGGRGLSLNNT